jgi:hypothetical protein
MTKPMISKRHAPPSLLQLQQRTYRGQLALKKYVANQIGFSLLAIASLQNQFNQLQGDLNISVATTAKQAATIKTLADHCQRLLREKELLVRMIGVGEIERHLTQANGYMATRLSVKEHTHGV